MITWVQPHLTGENPDNLGPATSILVSSLITWVLPLLTGENPDNLGPATSNW